MHRDHIDALLRQLLLSSENDHFLDMRHDNELRHRWTQLIMNRLVLAHVLGEILRLVDLADVVVIRSDAGQENIPADRLRRLPRQLLHAEQ